MFEEFLKKQSPITQPAGGRIKIIDDASYCQTVTSDVTTDSSNVEGWYFDLFWYCVSVVIFSFEPISQKYYQTIFK